MNSNYVIEITHEGWNGPEFKTVFGTRDTANRFFRDQRKWVLPTRIDRMAMYAVPDEVVTLANRANWRLVREERYSR